LHWLLEAKKRFGPCVLDYAVTSNHIHLLVKDTGPNVIAQSMQLIAGRTAQEYNQRKREAGSVLGGSLPCHGYEADEHLHHCLVYIDLNMVRAGVVTHPVKWLHSGYHEIQEGELAVRDACWSAAVAVGSLALSRQIERGSFQTFQSFQPFNRYATFTTGTGPSQMFKTFNR